MTRHELERLPGLGPKSRAMLEKAGIASVASLRALGAVAAFARVRQQQAGVSLNLLWALEGALTGCTWQQVARAHRTSLLLALESHEKKAALMPADNQKKPEPP